MPPLSSARRTARALVILATVALAPAFGAPAPASALTINPTFAASITGDPQAATIEATINSAIALFQSRIQDNLTVNVTFAQMTTGLGASSTSLYRFTYQSYLDALRAHASSLDDATVLSHLPEGPFNPVNGKDSVWVTSSLVRALALQPGVAPQEITTVLQPAPGDPFARPLDRDALRASLARLAAPASASQIASDGTISLNLGICNLSPAANDPNKYSLFSTTCHELDEVLGNGSALNGLSNGVPAPTGPLFGTDLFRYAVTGARSFHTNLADSSYLSFDGATLLARFNQKQGGDFSDFFSSGPHTPQVQDAFATPGTAPQPAVEWRLLDALGWSFAPRAYWVDFTTVSFLQVGTFDQPFHTLAQAASLAPPGSLILVEHGGHSLEPTPFTTAFTVAAVGLTTTLGQ